MLMHELHDDDDDAEGGKLASGRKRGKERRKKKSFLFPGGLWYFAASCCCCSSRLNLPPQELAVVTVIIMVAAPRVRGVALAPRHRRHQADQQGHRENVREEEGQKKQQVLMRKVGFATLARRGARRSIVPRCPAVIEARGLGLPRCPSGVGRGRGGRTARQINRQTEGAREMACAHRALFPRRRV